MINQSRLHRTVLRSLETARYPHLTFVISSFLQRIQPHHKPVLPNLKILQAHALAMITNVYENKLEDTENR
jgi:hypothetical protein